MPERCAKIRLTLETTQQIDNYPNFHCCLCFALSTSQSHGGLRRCQVGWWLPKMIVSLPVFSLSVYFFPCMPLLTCSNMLQLASIGIVVCCSGRHRRDERRKLTDTRDTRRRNVGYYAKQAPIRMPHLKKTHILSLAWTFRNNPRRMFFIYEWKSPGVRTCMPHDAHLELDPPIQRRQTLLWA